MGKNNLRNTDAVFYFLFPFHVHPPVLDIRREALEESKPEKVTFALTQLMPVDERQGSTGSFADEAQYGAAKVPGMSQLALIHQAQYHLSLAC